MPNGENPNPNSPTPSTPPKPAPPPPPASKPVPPNETIEQQQKREDEQREKEAKAREERDKKTRDLIEKSRKAQKEADLVPFVETPMDELGRKPRTLAEVIEQRVREPGDPPFPAFGEPGYAQLTTPVIDPRAAITVDSLLYQYWGRMSPWGQPKASGLSFP